MICMKTYHLNLPLSSEEIQNLYAGNIIYLTGKLFTARDEAHQRLVKTPGEKLPFDLDSLGLYHCGPLMKKTKKGWNVISAGPTTSSRLELFEPSILKKFPSLNVIIGKGGMGEGTLKTLQNRGVYLVYTGGAAALAADQIQMVEDVFWLDEMGMAEAVWIIQVKDFGPLIVGMDSHENSLFSKL
jgi:tartrate/fumarate subfamily iron-sulfur-dependent hydro-lyase beta chain